MSLTSIAWLLFCLACTLLILRRAVYGSILYLVVFFTLPDFWWWGKGTALEGQRWSLISGVVLLIAALLHNGLGRPADQPLVRQGRWLVFFWLLNCTFVHLFLTDIPEISAVEYVLVSKLALMFFCLSATIKNRDDLLLLFVFLLLSSGYIGYEVTINDQGGMVRGRLEGVGTAGSRGANALACLMVTVVPMFGALLYVGSTWQKWLVMLLGPFVLNVILMCNSRGAFLGLLAAGGVMLASAKGAARTRAIKGLGWAALAGFMLLNDPRIMERFLSTFAKAEERDESAASRLQYWEAGLLMAADYPLGAGGDGFKRMHGGRYLQQVGIFEDEDRAVHNGYLNDICEWGVQGLALRLGFFLVLALATYWAAAHAVRLGHAEDGFLGACLLSSLVAFLITAFFGDHLDSEWGLWWAALAVSYVRLCYLAQPVASYQLLPWALVDGRWTPVVPVAR